MKEFQAAKVLNLRTVEKGTRFQSNKWSTLDYIFTNAETSSAERWNHRAKTDHYPIGITAQICHRLKSPLKLWKLRKDATAEQVAVILANTGWPSKQMNKLQ